jgi:NAD dependent epimerase/dehydratase family enzyme
VDAGVITATTGFIGAVVALLGALGGGMAFLIRRADKKRETGEAMMVDHFKEQLRKAEQKNRWLNLALEIKTADGNAWREQLLRHDIEPEPDKWTAIPKLEDV